MAPAARTRILLAGDHALTLQAFRALLQPQFDVVGTVTDRRRLLAECPRLKPDVVLIDSPLAPTGVDMGRQLRLQDPGVRVLYLTTAADLRSSSAGPLDAAEYVLKSSAVRELKQAIRRAAKGHVTRRSAAPAPQPPAPSPARTSLTARQLEVLQLLAAGRSMKEAAGILAVTARTVAFHKYRMMGQLHVKTTAELVRVAVKQGIVGDLG